MVVLLAVWNLVFAVLAGLSGLYLTWGFEAVTSISLTMNKAMIGSFGLVSFSLMIWIRYRYGPELWEDLSLKVSYASLGFISAGTAIVTGSLGGEAALLGTVLEWLWRALNIEPRYPMVLPIWGSAVVLALIAAGIGSMLMIRLLGRPSRKDD
jgi:hypothetical protein